MEIIHTQLLSAPKGYILHLKDRNSKNHRTGGGVRLAITNEYNSEYVPELDTDCELVWAKMNLKGNGNIYIAHTTADM